jgi:hypothetical protein
MGKAAAVLNTTQSAVSRSIADLENAVGVRLLDRSPQGVEPTSYGRALLKRGTAVFDELKQSVQDIESLSDPDRENSASEAPRSRQKGSRLRSSIGCRGNIRASPFRSPWAECWNCLTACGSVALILGSRACPGPRLRRISIRSCCSTIHRWLWLAPQIHGLTGARSSSPNW